MKCLLILLVGVMMSCTNSDKRTVVSIQKDQFYINNKPTYKGRYWNGHKVEGLLLNSRMVNGIFDDENPETKDRFKYPDTGEWDPERNTREFVESMELWKSYGLNSFTLNLQGGSPTGYGNRGCINTAFDAKGNLKPMFLDRLSKILNKANELSYNFV